ncbi:UNVERIFIED_CONTAM: hypothetical protein GTU68_014124 [Idotea baltica]|nr:hypothetical protein [Idotea baltica]
MGGVGHADQYPMLPERPFGLLEFEIPAQDALGTEESRRPLCGESR